MRRKRKLGRHVHSEVTRHGQRVFYYRVGGGARIRLPDDCNSQDFRDAVRQVRESGKMRGATALPPIEAMGRTKLETAIVNIVRGARSRAKLKAVPFDLDIEWALDLARSQNFCCALTRIPFSVDRPRANTRIGPFAPSFDRIEPHLGYTKENVRLVVFALNVMFMDWGQEVFERVVNRYRRNKGEKNRALFPHLSQEVRAARRVSKLKQRDRTVMVRPREVA